jgi:PAS domain S-box-containing protein
MSMLAQNVAKQRTLLSVGHSFVLTSVMLTLAILAGTGWLIQASRAVIYDRAVRAGENVLLGLEHDIRHSVDTMDIALRAAISGTRLPELAALPADVRQAVLFDGAIGTQVFGGVSITDERGQVVYASTAETPLSVNVSDRYYFKAHRARADLGLLMTGPTLSPMDGRWSLLLSRRVNRPDGTFAGIAVGSIELDIILEMFDKLSTGGAGVVALFTTDGRLLVRKPAETAAMDRDISGGSLVARITQTASGAYETRSLTDHVDRVVVYRQVGSYPLGILIAISSDELYAGWFERALMVTGALGSLMLLAAGLGWSLRRELRRRAAAEHVARSYVDEVRMLTDHASDLLLRLDWDGRCRFASPASQSVLGYPDYALVMRNWLDLVHPEDRDLLMPGFLDQGDPPPSPPVVRVQHHDGTWRQVEARGRALPAGRGVIVVVRDVTRRMELEAKLVQADRMEALGQLTAGVAHDFNNILQAQLACLELLLDSLADSPEPWALASQALELGERGARLTSQLRSFSRQQHLHPQAISVSAFLSHLIETIGKAVGPAIRLVPWVEPGTPAIFADRAHLESALLNLVFNARDAMPDGGTIRIQARAAPPSVSRPDQQAQRHVLLSVGDHGTGMDSKTLERACEPFFTTKGAHGTGLGLSSVQGFIAQSRGEFHIRSAQGQGTTVELSLPAVAEEVPDCASQDVPRTQTVGRLLFVDDAPDVLVTVGSFLRGAGFEVVPAWGAEMALRALREDGPFDCLVTDFAMPGMDGIELISQARAICPGLPALVITAWMEDARLAGAGPIEVLQKPFRRDALVRELQRIIASPQSKPSHSPLVEGIRIREQ